MRFFVEGAIDPMMIAEMIQKHQSKTAIGAHELFLGQVRADQLEEKRVAGIEYSTYAEMAERELEAIREEAFAQFGISCSHILHSRGTVATGQLCFIVFVSAPHRKEARAACAFMVDAVKSRAPIFGKELFEDATHQWKVNR